MKKINSKKQFLMVILVLLAILFFVSVFSITLGSAKISCADSFKVVLSKLPLLDNLIDTSEILPSSNIIITNVRLPRILLAIIVGIGLSCSGAVYQGILKNSMADPYILGVSSGAALGATVAIITNTLNVKILAFCFSIITAIFVYLISKNGIKKNSTSIILTGININYFITSLISLIMILNKDKLDKIVYWTMGTLSTSNWGNVWIAFISVMSCFIIISLLAKYINAISISEDFAKSVGINTILLKKVLILLISFITSICVSITGIIGFVGLMIPHIVRLVFTNDYRFVIPISRNSRCYIFTRF